MVVSGMRKTVAKLKGAYILETKMVQSDEGDKIVLAKVQRKKTGFLQISKYGAEFIDEEQWNTLSENPTLNSSYLNTIKLAKIYAAFRIGKEKIHIYSKDKDIWIRFTFKGKQNDLEIDEISEDQHFDDYTTYRLRDM